MDQFLRGGLSQPADLDDAAALFIFQCSDKLGSVEATKKIEALRDPFTRIQFKELPSKRRVFFGQMEKRPFKPVNTVPC